MSWFKLLAAASSLVAVSSAKELPWDEARSKEIYQNGAMMSMIRNQKEAVWAKQRANGMMDSSVYPEIKDTVKCVNGVAEAIPGNANYTFQCNNVRHESHEALDCKANSSDYRLT